MAEPLNLTIKVNTETGQLEVLGAKFREVGDQSKSLTSAFSGLTGEAKNLLGAFLPFASAAGVVAFFAGAVKAAEEENEALRRLQFGLEASGVSWSKNEAAINQWASTLQASTRFSDTQALEALDKLVRVTGDLTQSQRAVQLAMGLSTASGKDLATTTQMVTDLVNGNERAVLSLRREFGSFIGDASNTQDVLDILNQQFGDAATKEDSFTKSSSQLKAAFSDLQETVGRALIPGLQIFVDILKEGIEWVQKIGAALAGFSAIALETAQGIARGMKEAFKLNFSAVRDIAKETFERIQETVLESAEQIEAVEQIKTESTLQHSEVRIIAREREVEEEKKKSEETVQIKAETVDRFAELEDELDRRIAQIGDQTYQKKKALLDAEVRAQVDKINKEVKNETEKEKLLNKLLVLRQKSVQALALDEAKQKRMVALDTIDTALQALTIINNMEEGHSKAQATRAKAILVLEKAIAIARAIAAAQSAGPGAAILAAAQVALITAQFAQQFKAIDDARRVSDSSRQEFKVTTDLGGGRELSKISLEGPDGTPGLGLGSGASAAPFDRAIVATGGASGGSGTVTINVGGVVVNFSTEHVDLQEVDSILRRLADSVRRGTTEGVQLALAVQRTADRNLQLAI